MTPATSNRSRRNKAVNSLDSLQNLYKHYDIDATSADASGERNTTARKVNLSEATKDPDAQRVLSRLVELNGEGRVVELADRMKEIGAPGTLIRDGKLRIEQNYKAMPFILRGRRGRPGTLEEFYRTEPVIMDSVDSVVEVQVGAERPILPPKDDLIDEEDKEDMQEWCQQLEGWFGNLEGEGLDGYIFNAAHSCALFGFAPSEIVWAVDDEYQASGGKEGLAWPVKLADRNVETLEEWIMNDKQDTLLGASFDTGGEAQLTYTLTNTGPKLTDNQLLLCRKNGRGNNWEGISPVRPAMHWVRFKKLLGQIAAVAAQKYGVPITILKVDASLVTDMVMSTLNVNEEDITDAIETFDAAEAVEAGVYYLPAPLTAETTGPQGTMPTLEDMLRYCDEMITRPFSNEGSLLGHNHTGSFALSETSENKFLRGAPAWSRVIMQPINEIIRLMTIQRFGKKLLAYPKMGLRLNSRDGREVLKELVGAMAGVPLSEWPKALQEEALELFGFARDLLEDEIEEIQGDIEPDEEEAIEAQEVREFSVEQITKMVEIAQSVSAKEITEQAGAAIMKLTFGLTDDEVNNFFLIREPAELSESCGCKDHTPIRTVELSESMVISLEEFRARAEDVKVFMDSTESALARDWQRIAEEQRREFKKLTEGVTDPFELDAIGDQMIASYRRRYFDVAMAHAKALQMEGIESLMRELRVPTDLQENELPDLPDGEKEQLEATVLQASKEANSRNVQNMIDQRVRQATEAAADKPQRSITKLALSTLSAIAQKITGRSFNIGRDAVVERSIERYEQRTGVEVAGARSPSKARGDVTQKGVKVFTAVRSSMLDNNVCAECKRLDFENGGPEVTVGSATYYRNMPPEPCLGGSRCRCVYIYAAEPEMIEAVSEFVNARMVI